MQSKVKRVKVDFKHDKLKVRVYGSSPRGTPILIKHGEVSRGGKPTGAAIKQLQSLLESAGVPGQAD